MRSISLVSMIFLLLVSCSKQDRSKNGNNLPNKKVGVLIVSHGSHSDSWRNTLLSMEDSVRSSVLSNKNISGIKSAFMEYNEPSIATRLKEFEAEGYSDVVIIPILLTISNHSYDDIPTIAGVKKNPTDIENIKKEKIEIYQGKLNLAITPLLDFPKVLADNVIRRMKLISTDAANEACVIVAYGSREYDKEWIKLIEDIENKIKSESKIVYTNYAWCGHIADYKPNMIKDSLKKALSMKPKVLLIPLLLAYDEMFQGGIIANAIKMTKKSDKIVYKPDAILPDSNVENWIVQVSHQFADKIKSHSKQ